MTVKCGFHNSILKTLNALERLSYNKTFQQRPAIEQFLISKYHYFECVSEKCGIIKASEFIRRNDIIPLKIDKKQCNAHTVPQTTIVYTSS